MVGLTEVRARQAAVITALRDLALAVERATHLGVGAPDDEIGWWARLVVREIEESTTKVLQAARELRRVLA